MLLLRHADNQDFYHRDLTTLTNSDASVNIASTLTTATLNNEFVGNIDTENYTNLSHYLHIICG
ncbi:hypothetical protein NIES4074_15170 [Cylindrospermum sp. NIES-4074]|nr:hypothetical protein NIES4074_15170 [Cylindrospermum sp. NIES-4074]